MAIRHSGTAAALEAELAALQPASGEAELHLPFTVEPWLFGGGIVPRTADPGELVRPAGLVGAWRFFWRLLAGSRNPAELRAAESERFGSIARPAPFRLTVRVVASGVSVPAPRPGEPCGSVTFAAREERDRGVVLQPAAWLRAGVAAEAVLRGTLPADLLAAVRTWTLLGGIGARTRRGLGAVQVSPACGSVAALDRELQRLLAGAPRTQKPGGVLRSIAQLWRSESVYPSAEAALADLDRWYKRYRQDRNGPRGRSFWDEPELIRGLTGKRLSRHTRETTPPGRHAPGFARAALGLPIAFAFREGAGDRFDRRDRDPWTTVLRGLEADRLASPLLFRPVAVAPGSYVALVALLSAPYEPAGGLGLDLEPGRAGTAALKRVALTPDVPLVFTELFRWGKSSPLKLTRVV